MADKKRWFRRTGEGQEKKREIMGLIILVFLLLIAGLIIGRLTAPEEQEEDTSMWSTVQTKEAEERPFFYHYLRI
ncbi:hypothetical protein ACFOGI_16100 [Virgibacillus xinjiangensis]|uniref:Uncharacterized protein n=1 Tax=Virgibacillus xinjiangensis TaxID=393090 RepID=A0ABV7CZA3_9BACI